MKFQLETLEYQEEAIKSVLEVFSGTAKNTFDNATIEGIRKNICNLSKNEIKNNIEKIVLNNNISLETAKLSDNNDLCIEMETGTGKTLVYLKTIYELYKEYQFSKFIILVPSVAIREGILSTFNAFKEQLKDIYNIEPTLFEYISKKLNKVVSFIEEQHPQIMLMTLASFNSEDRILNQAQRENLFNNTPFIEGIAKTNPIILMDEPQVGMDTENSIKQIAKLNPLYKIRYSATHKIIKNLLYRLTPYDSYKQGLVKKIEVLTVSEKNDEATLKIELVSIKNETGKPKAILKAWKLKGGKYVFDLVKNIKDGDNLGEKTKNPSYNNYKIERINKSLKTGKWSIKFANGIELFEKQTSTNIESIWNLQMEWLMHRHFKKYLELEQKGIKCLSLVFIDRVSNYVGSEPIIKNIFIKKYKEIYPEYYNGTEPTTEQIEAVQGYYFATTTKGEYTDNKNSIKKNKKIFELILKKKNELLSLDNPVQIIFSHSALGVGWDNPNIFNIATLNNSFSEIKKRQEIGRGLRICVNQEGNRIYDNNEEEERVNNLTVIPNETYETFVTQYQSEINEIYGSDSDGAKFTHSHKGKKQNKISFKLNKNETVNTAFKRFWKKMAKKTRYNTYFNDEDLIENASKKINEIEISDYLVEVASHSIDNFKENEINTSFGGKETYKQKASFSITDVFEEISKNTGLSYPATQKILGNIKNIDQLIKNPPKFTQKMISIIKNVELDEMYRGLSYELTGETFDFDFKNFTKQKAYREYVETPNKGFFDKMIIDSNNEYLFAIGAEDPMRDEVVAFMKLPDYYKIETPIGTYNPDFGLVMKRKQLKNGSEEEFNFVIEIKGTNDLEDKKSLKASEVYKIKCAIKHFNALGVEAFFKAPIKDFITFEEQANRIIDNNYEEKYY